MAEHNIQQLNRFKIERENTIQFPLRKMLKDSISEYILSDIKNVNVKLWKELSCISKVSNKDDVKRLKHFVKNNKSNLGSMLYDGLIIMEIEDWIENARLRLGKEYPDALIYIGRSFVNPKELIIGGVVNDNDEQKLFENYFNNQNPPVPIHFKIIIQN